MLRHMNSSRLSRTPSRLSALRGVVTLVVFLAALTTQPSPARAQLGDSDAWAGLAGTHCCGSYDAWPRVLTVAR